MQKSNRNKVLIGIIVVFAVVALSALLMFYFETYISPEGIGIGKEGQQEIEEPPAPMDTVVNVLFRAMVESSLPQVPMTDEEFVWKALRTDENGKTEAVDIRITAKGVSFAGITQGFYKPPGDFFMKDGFISPRGILPGKNDIFLDGYQKDDIVCLVSESITIMPVPDSKDGLESFQATALPPQALRIRCGIIQPRDMRGLAPPSPKEQAAVTPIVAKVGQLFEISATADDFNQNGPEIKYDGNYLIQVASVLSPPTPELFRNVERNDTSPIIRGIWSLRFMPVKTGDTRMTLIYNKLGQDGLEPGRQDSYSVRIEQ